MLDHQRHPRTSGESPLTVALREQDQRAAISRFYVPSDKAVREELARRVASRIVGKACQENLVVIGCGSDLQRLIEDELVRVGAA